MFRITVATALLLTCATCSPGADDVAPVLKSGSWYVDVRAGVMGTRYEYTFRKNGTFAVEITNDVANPSATGTWKLDAKDGKQVLVLDTKGKQGHALPPESEVSFDRAKNVLICRGKDGAEVVLKFHKGR